MTQIGIFTLQDTITEGGVAQAVALAASVIRLSGADVEFAHYHSPNRRHFKTFNPLMPHIRQLIQPLSHDLYHPREVSAWADGKDLVIFGSDEIWKHSDAVYFGAVKTRTPMATYGGCCGGAIRREELTGHLKRQQLVTVRDRFTQAAVKNACGMHCGLVPDPVLLENEYCNSPYKPKEPQILAYNKLAYQVRKNLSGSFPVLDVYKTVEGSPEEQWRQWCELPRSTDISVVITSAFHPTHMAILAGKPVITFDQRNKTREVVGDFYGEKYCLKSWNHLTPDLIVEAIEDFDMNQHVGLLRQRREQGIRQLKKILACAKNS